MLARVPGEGNPNARLAIVGMAPGAQELIEGRPFVGYSGKLLMQALQRAGLSRAECYITNVLKFRPPNDDMSPFFYDPHRETQPKPELEKAILELRDELLAVKPNVVLALGKHALFALTRRTEITKIRGSVLSSTLIEGLKVVASVHPAMVLRMWKWKPMLFADVEKAVKESVTPAIIKPDRLFAISPTLNQVEQFIATCVSRGLMCIDVEASRARKPIKCIGLAYDKHNAMSIPILTSKGHYWSSRDEARIWRLIDEALNSVTLRVGHNLFYDLLMLGELYGIRLKEISSANTFDTMIAFHSIYPEMPKSLEFLCSVYSTEPYYKDEGAEAAAKLDDLTLWNYNCKDTVVTIEAMESLKSELEAMDCWKIYDFQIASMEPALFLAIRGLKVDLAERDRAIKVLEAQIEAETEALAKAIGRPINVNSSRQVTQLLRELGCDVKTTKKDELEALSDKYDMPIINTIISIREKIKIKSTYYEAKLFDNRFKFSVNLTGAESGRWSTSSHPFDVGGNIHSSPRGAFRRTIVPDDGCVFIGGDFVQAEARVVAYLSNDTALIEAFESGRPVYRELASIVFGIPIEQVTAEQAYKAKKLTHASNYGIGHRKFARVARIPEDKSKELLDAYYSNTNVKYYHTWVESELRKKMCLVTPFFKRKRVFFDRWGDSLLREAYSYIPQSLVADINTLLLQRVYYELGDKVDIAISAHDQVVMQVRAELVDEVKPVIEQLSKIPIEINGRTMIIPFLVKVGKNWEEVS